MLRGDVFPLQL
uniref:Uncharacterized protein n=1 Tax=Anguilla anguilla TaxID=7936 RepID=A0A0E9TBR7_ANGAN